MTVRSLSRDQKQRLAAAVITQVADMFENWEERVESGFLDDCADIDVSAAGQQVADWIGRLPGPKWDVRLPQPSYL